MAHPTVRTSPLDAFVQILADRYPLESILAEHRGRFYVHKLNAELNVDASFVGNEARYINHAKGRDANCTVKSTWFRPASDVYTQLMV